MRTSIRAVPATPSENTRHPIFWFWSFAKKPLFSQANLLKLAPGLTATTIQNWANRSIVSAFIEMKEVRGRRYYDSMQVNRIVLGHRLMNDFGLPPIEAMLSIDYANACVIGAWTGDAVDGAETTDTKMPIKPEWIEQYWFVQAASMKNSVAVKASGLGSAIEKLGSSIVIPYGRDHAELASKARKLHEESGAADGDRD
jgi:hypothetical protein